MAILIMFLAAICAATSNLCMRKSIDAGGSTRGFLVIQQLFCFFTAILLGPIASGNTTFDGLSAGLGLGMGVALGFMMWALGKSFETGPSALSIVALNASTIMPGIIMALLFGAALGFDYSSFNALGSLLVVLGFVWAAGGSQLGTGKFKWLFFCLLAFFLHTLVLVFMQWRVLLFRPDVAISTLVPFKLDPSSIEWMMPMVFVSSTLIQLGIYLKKEKRFFLKKEVLYSAIAGLANGACMFLSFKAAECATAKENAMIFPAFSVGVVLLCNLWGRTLYKERVHWLATGLCVLGLIVGTVDWKLVF